MGTSGNSTACAEKPKGKRDDKEGREQAWLIEWSMLAWFVDRNGDTCRVYDYLFAIPNGGHRDKRVAVKLKAQGVKAGVSDLMLPVPMQVFPGLWIEMKVKGNTLTDLQEEWFIKMHRQGYMCVMCVGWKAAAETIASYVGGVKTKSGQPLRVL